VSLSIRAARPEDAATVFALVRALADYEKLLHELVATPDMIAAALFADKPTVFCEIAEWDGKPVGLALWFLNFSSFAGKNGIYLEDIFVEPAYRGKGIGKALLVHLAKICTARGYARMQWSVLDWNKPSIDFYKSLGGVMLDDWTLVRVSGDALANLARGSA
jgi:diamine N-acetyltransferase